MPHFVIHSSANDHFGCFHLLTIINNADMNMGGQMSVQVPAFLCFRYDGFVNKISDYISKKVADIHSTLALHQIYIYLTVVSFSPSQVLSTPSCEF